MCPVLFEDFCPQNQAEPCLLSRGAWISGMMFGCVLCSFTSTTSGSSRPGPALQWAAPGAKASDHQTGLWLPVALHVYAADRDVASQHNGIGTVVAGALATAKTGTGVLALMTLSTPLLSQLALT